MKKNIKSTIRNLARATRGANMVEYIILVGIVALLAVVGFQAFSKSVQTTVQTQGTTIEGVQANGAGNLGHN
ncbi:MAG: hypothetical protein JWP97_3993 [Labilithrix sp.]|nr:hypothetical protein [Labilithrix sp.]